MTRPPRLDCPHLLLYHLEHKACGGNWFDPGMMRFFKSRVVGEMVGRYFVTSEKGPDQVRR